ncbi:RNA polymerase sigma factor [Streptomyces zhihengii]
MSQVTRVSDGEAGGEAPLASPQGFEAFYNANVRNLLNYAYVQLGSLQDAEEVVQDVFVTAVRKWDQLLAADNLNALFFTMLKHRVIDQRRRRRRMALVEISGDWLTEEQVSAEDPGLKGLEARLLLQTALGRLPERQRDALTLKYFLGLSSRQVADMMGVAEPTVSAHLKRGRERLARLLDLDYGDCRPCTRGLP